MSSNPVPQQSTMSATGQDITLIIPATQSNLEEEMDCYYWDYSLFPAATAQHSYHFSLDQIRAVQPSVAGL